MLRARALAGPRGQWPLAARPWIPEKPRPEIQRLAVRGSARRGVHATTTTGPPPHLFSRVLDHAARPALFEPRQPGPWTYAQLLDEAARLRESITQALPRVRDYASSAAPPRVAFLGSRDASYVAIQWATWLAGGVAVPLHAAHPVEELQYIMDDSAASVLVVSEPFLDGGGESTARLREFIQWVRTRGRAVVVPHARPQWTPTTTTREELVRKWVRDTPLDAHAAQIVYTSGTTGRPKGVVSTHAALTAQTHDVVTAWEMTPRDHLLHFLPLHHVHGVLNNLLCVHYAGGSLEFLPSAAAALVWRKLAESHGAAAPNKRPVTMLMAVPTVYMNLLEDIERDGPRSYDTPAAVAAARALRVAISGSMACPVSILNRWETLTGLRLLERYGMTELGMALTNPLHGERHLGYVGKPFPSVRVRLVDTDTEEELSLEAEREGELRVKGPTVFQQYWRKPEATAKEFDADGWFKTGDVAQYSAAHASFRIRGRASADIIKSGGYKISALDVERVLLTHPQVLECAVFGIADEKWGQVVAAVVRASARTTGESPALEPPLDAFAKEHLADYRVPRRLFFVDEIPKNAMGKVNKKALAAMYAQQ